MSIASRFKDFYANSKHVLSVSYKPDTAEFRRTLKIVLIGALIMGIMGYIISVIIGAIIHV